MHSLISSDFLIFRLLVNFSIMSCVSGSHRKVLLNVNFLFLICFNKPPLSYLNAYS